MRKILLATTAIIGFVGAAQAAESPVAVNVGGYVDFRAGLFDRTNKIAANERSGDFTNEFQINVDATGKATNGVEYGAHVGLWNGERDAGTTISEHDAYLWLSGQYGKVLMGDTHNATEDLFVFAPTVGLGQIDGKYTDFTSNTTLVSFTPIYSIDDNNDTRVTYYTPKIGTQNHKIQFGASYTPNPGNVGHAVRRVTSSFGYRDQFDLAAQYVGTFDAVKVTVSPVYRKAEGNTFVRDYANYGLGAQVAYDKATIGGSYFDAGHINTSRTQDKAQTAWTLGAKYDFGKTQLAASYINMRGYTNYDPTLDDAYGEAYDRISQIFAVGAVYNWFPGMTTNMDALLIKSKGDKTGTPTPENTIDRILMVSQKMVF